ncbi:MAG: sigma-70 family RNA polymerase sigma factor [Gemmataceae bacterium]
MRNGITPREAVILGHYGLALAVVKNLRRRYPAVNFLDSDDAVQTGLLALIRAADKFDPAKQVTFGHYAWVIIRRAVLQAARRNCLIRVPSSRRDSISWSCLSEEICPPCPQNDALDLDSEKWLPKLLALADDLASGERLLCYKAFGLRGYARQKLSDIARESGCTRQNVSLRLKRILARLRRQALEFRPPCEGLSDNSIAAAGSRTRHLKESKREQATRYLRAG